MSEADQLRICQIRVANYLALEAEHLRDLGVAPDTPLLLRIERAARRMFEEVGEPAPEHLGNWDEALRRLLAGT